MLWQLAAIEERQRLAGEIHDTLVQEFAGILLHLEAARGAANNRPHELGRVLARARELAKSGLEDTRRMLLGLRPRALEGAHIAGALHQLAGSFSRDCGRDCKFIHSGEPHELPEHVQDELFRVAQEALWNVRKHSGATCVSIALSYNPGAIVLKIRDDGRGFPAKKKRTEGFGLQSMCERARRIGGKMEVHSGREIGTEVTVTVPINQTTRGDDIQ